MPSWAPGTSQRRPWMAMVIWGWRLEVTLSLITVIGLLVAGRLGLWASVLVVGAVLLVLRHKPELRRGIERRIRRNRSERNLHLAFWHCVVVGRRGDIPKVVRIGQVPVGQRILVRLPIGLHFEAVAKRAPEVAAALGAREVRVRPVPQSATYVELVVVRTGSFPATIGSPLKNVECTSLWEPLEIGIDEDGLPVTLGLAEHNLLIGGEPGSGKSVALSTIVGHAALDPTARLTILDGKQVELAAWSPVVDRLVGPDQGEALDALEGLRRTMDARYATLAATRRRKLTAGDAEGLHVLVIDELAFFLRGGRKEVREAFAEQLRDLVSRGRAAGVIVVAATQKPSHEVVPTWIRDLFSFRLAMRCTSPDASDTILGQGWATQGFSASTIDPARRGVGYLLAEGGSPQLILTPLLGDDEVDGIATRAARHREVR